MTGAPLWAEALVAAAVAAWALWSGPALLTLRWVGRTVGLADPRRSATVLRHGLLVAAIGAVGIETARDGQPLMVAVVLLVLLLALCDRAWRWLPPEWSAAIGIAGLWSAMQQGHIGVALIGGLLPSGGLWLLRGMLWRRIGAEPLGLGDVWLIAAIGIWLGPQMAVLVLGFAALFGLLEVAADRLKARATGRGPSNGAVAFGTHLCTVFAIAALAVP